jgi:NADPH:quinone reductase
MGRDFAGIVVEPPSSPLCGKEVFGTSGHDLSFTIDGAYAEYVLVREKAVARKPENLSFAQAASVCTPYTTASLAIRRSRLQPTETVLVVGATGAVGTAATQIATQMGCTVLTAARNPACSINLKEDPNLQTAKDLTHGKGPDVAIDTVGDLALTHSALASLSTGGRLSFISVGRSTTSEMQVDMKMLYRLERAIIGSNSIEHDAEEMAEWLSEIGLLFEKGELKAISDKELTQIRIEDFATAFDGSTKGKIVIMLDP